MEQRYETFTLLIAKINRSIRRIKTDEMMQFSLKGPHVSCLHYLSLDGPMTAAELCERCEEDKAAVSRSLEYLRANGYIAADGAAGRYKCRLSLTERGTAVCAAMGASIERILDAASAGLDEDSRRAMYHALDVISANLEQIAQQKQPGADKLPAKHKTGEEETK